MFTSYSLTPNTTRNAFATVPICRQFAWGISQETYVHTNNGFSRSHRESLKVHCLEHFHHWALAAGWLIVNRKKHRGAIDIGIVKTWKWRLTLQRFRAIPRRRRLICPWLLCACLQRFNLHRPPYHPQDPVNYEPVVWKYASEEWGYP